MIPVPNITKNMKTDLNLDSDVDLIREECAQSYEAECPICRDEIKENMTILRPCGHVFCRGCISLWIERDVSIKKCPLCWQEIQELTHFNSVSFAQLAPYKHVNCGFLCGIDDTSKSYIYSLSQEWLKLVRFMLRTHSDPDNFQGVKGIEHLNLKTINQDDVISKKRGYISYIKSSRFGMAEQFNLVICTLLPNLSVMLLIRDGESFEDVEPDNEYADEVVQLLNNQMKVCWRDVKDQLPRAQRFMYVRQFKKMTCSLLLVPGGWNKTTTTHFRPLSKDFRNLRAYNFNAVHFNKILRFFPTHVPNNLAMGPGYQSDRCCQRLAK